MIGIGDRTFNGPVEAGLRAVAWLEAFHPRRCGPIEIAFLDYAIVHTADFGGPASLHPAMPARLGELAVRTDLVPEGLELMRIAGFVEAAEGGGGRTYVAGEGIRDFLGSLSDHPYCAGLVERAKWLASAFGAVPADGLAERLRALSAELSRAPIPDDPDEAVDPAGAARVRDASFALLAEAYASDEVRMAFLAGAADHLARVLGRDGTPGPDQAGLADELDRVARAARRDAAIAARDGAGLAALIREAAA